MTELERKALLGDIEAQRKCTEMGIILPCPFCGGRAILFECGGLHGVKRTDTTCIGYDSIAEYGGSISAVKDWNTRPAPPIGRCGECKNAPFLSSRIKGMRWCRKFRSDVNSNDFCSCFEPKEREE